MIHNISKIAIGATVVGVLAAGLAYAQTPSTPQRSDNAASAASELNNNNSRGTGVYNSNNNSTPDSTPNSTPNSTNPDRAGTLGNQANDRNLRDNTGNTTGRGMDTDRNNMPNAGRMDSDNRSMNNGMRAPRNDRN